MVANVSGKKLAAAASEAPGFSTAPFTCASVRFASRDTPPPVSDSYDAARSRALSRALSIANRAYCGSSAAYVPKVIMSASASATTLCASSPTGEIEYSGACATLRIAASGNPACERSRIACVNTCPCLATAPDAFSRIAFTCAITGICTGALCAARAMSPCIFFCSVATLSANDVD